MEFPFERKAMSGEPLPIGLDIADECAYIALQNLYDMYHRNAVSRTQASKIKDTIVASWETQKSKIEFLNRSSEVLRDLIKETSDAYKKEPTINNADKLYAAFYNLPKNWREKEV